jgi:hypothetical protein
MNSGQTEGFVEQISRTLRDSTVKDDQSTGTIVLQSNDILGLEVRKPKHFVKKEICALNFLGIQNITQG